MMPTRIFFCLLVLLFHCAGAAGREEKRVALVIGNSAYQHTAALKNPTNDARDVSDALREVGFDVITGLDLDRAAMQEAVEEFGRRIKDADVSLFYYAGHGFQLRDENYLVPVDARLNKASDLQQQMVSIAEVLQPLEKGTRLVFLDACRNDPTGKSRSGLAVMEGRAGFLFAFATAAGKVAYDGAGRNSFFSRAIVSQLNVPGQDINAMMINVRNDVLAATGGGQIPWVSESLTARFSFKEGDGPAISDEAQLWRLASATKSGPLAKIYLERFPEGPHAGDMSAALAQHPAIDTTPTGSVGESSGDDTEDALWRIAQRIRTRSILDEYLRVHPKGRYGERARAILAALPSAEARPSAAEQCERLATHPRDGTANVEGVSWETLAAHAEEAVSECRIAVREHPEQVHYLALLARALYAVGNKPEAITAYQDAASHGDLRAMVSLGLLVANGDGTKKDPARANALYEKAAAGGSADGAINLAVELLEGRTIKRNRARAVELLERASAEGWPIATYNLGALAQNGLRTTYPAIDYFRLAAEQGDPRGYLAAAILLDEGRTTKKDPSAAAQHLLNAVAFDSADAFNQITANSKDWSPETIAALQRWLEAHGYSSEGGGGLKGALSAWRTNGAEGLQ